MRENIAPPDQLIKKYGGHDENAWKMESVPNWGKKWMEEVDFADLSKADFFSIYAKNWRPLVIRNACRDWPAYTKWASDAYLMQHWGDAKLEVFSQPAPETFHSERRKFEATICKPTSLSDFIQAPSSNLKITSAPFSVRNGLATMVNDVDDGWLYETTRPSRAYSKHRIFFHKGSTTPWHTHILDDHMTFQVRGQKDFAMMPITDSHLICDVQNNEMYSFNVDVEKYPKYTQISPFCARLQAGDAIYIPPGWWHLVTPPTQEFGITVASTWGSPSSTLLRKGVPSFFVKGNRKFGELPMVLGDIVKDLLYRRKK